MLPALDAVRTLPGGYADRQKGSAWLGGLGLSQSDKQRMLSNGIAEAMYNTALGLGIAVFCMIMHILLHTRAKAIQHDLETTMERTFNLLTISQRT